MQSFSDIKTPFTCPDCKRTYLSAALLLKHFTEHIIHVNVIRTETTKHNNNNHQYIESESSEETRNNDSILERVLTSSPDESELSHVSDKDETYLESSSCENNKQVLYDLTPGNNNNNNHVDNNKNITYAKIDLQQRLETCVNNDENLEEKCCNSTITNEHDEFNPLKFCVVTLEEGNEKIELTNKLINGQPQQQSVKKYVCTYCSKRFGWSTDLKRHILTHTGERPFQCQYCRATFTRNFLLQKHVLKIHKKNFVQTNKEILPMKINGAVISEDAVKTDQEDCSEMACLSKRPKQGTISLNI